jgi:hypothetical protein
VVAPVNPNPGGGRIVDTVSSDVAGCDLTARLDNFAIELQNEPGAQGYIISYNGPTRSHQDYAQKILGVAKNYLVQTRGIDASRIVTVDGGVRDDLTTVLFIVPSGAVPPTP